MRGKRGKEEVTEGARMEFLKMRAINLMAQTHLASNPLK